MNEVMLFGKAMIKDVVEIVESPFNLGTTFLGVDSRTSANGKKARIKKEGEKN
jgi:hypothetical protein